MFRSQENGETVMSQSNSGVYGDPNNEPCTAGCGRPRVANSELTCGADECLQAIYPGSSDNDETARIEARSARAWKLFNDSVAAGGRAGAAAEEAYDNACATCGQRNEGTHEFADVLLSTLLLALDAR